MCDGVSNSHTTVIVGHIISFSGFVKPPLSLQLTSMHSFADRQLIVSYFCILIMAILIMIISVVRIVIIMTPLLNPHNQESS